MTENEHNVFSAAKPYPSHSELLGALAKAASPTGMDHPRLPNLLVDKVRIAATIIRSCDAGSRIAQRLDRLEGRLLGQQLHLAVLGQFKRGKSSFINALLGAAVLPTAVVPLTAIATYIAWGQVPLVRITFRGSSIPAELSSGDPGVIREFLHRFVAEESNPKNRLDVERIDLNFPSALLANGTILIDTPGVGSTNLHNTETAFQILPECDAVLFVVSADPPVTEIEIDYLKRLGTQVATIVFVVNKIDYLDPAELIDVTEFLRRTLSDKAQLRDDALIFCLSARDALRAKAAGDLQLLKESGIAAAEAYLAGHLATEKVRTLEAAVAAKTVAALTLAIGEFELRTKALQMPLEELVKENGVFARALCSIDEQLELMPGTIAGNKRRMMDKLERRIENLRTEVSKTLVDLVDEQLVHSPDWGNTAREALAKLTEETFLQAQKAFQKTVSDDVAKVLSSQQGRIDTLVDMVRRTASEIFELPFAEIDDAPPFRLAVEPYWVTRAENPMLLPDPVRWIQHFLPATLRRRHLRNRVIEDTHEIVLRNSENLRWAFRRGLDDTFLKTEVQFREQMDSAIAATKGVIERTLKLRKEQTTTVAPQIDHLTKAIASINLLKADIAGMGPCQP